MTLNSNNSRKGELRPLPMRITQLQFERLDGARQRDGLAMQEHVRRALDYYLQMLDREAARAPAVATGSVPREPASDDKARLVDHGNDPFGGRAMEPSHGFAATSVGTTPQLRSR